MTVFHLWYQILVLDAQTDLTSPWLLMLETPAYAIVPLSHLLPAL
jgi:hypothetical protein